MSKSIAEIVSILWERKKARAPLLTRAIDIRDQYNGDVVIPLPELAEAERPAVANLLVSGLDQTAMRASSTRPDTLFPPLRPGIEKQEQAARDRTMAMRGIWQKNKMPIKTRRRTRFYSAYAASPVVIQPNFKWRFPEWNVRDPLTTYPSDTEFDDMCPDDCIFTYYRSLKWLMERYPDVAARIVSREMGRNGQQQPKPDQLYQLVEYVDGEETVLGVLGKVQSAFETLDGGDVHELSRAPNLTEVCPAVIPGRITLDRPQGQFDSLVGMFQQQARLQALAIRATEQGIFKDLWIVARPNEEPDIVQMADGRTGQYGKIVGGDIKEVGVDPSYMTNPMIDRLEAAQRTEGGIPAQYSGLAPSNLRTGRANDSVLSAAVDMTIQEIQEVFAISLEEENKRAIAIDKAYWNRPKSFYVDWKGKSARVDYTPQKLWTTDEHTVVYAQAGADINQLTVLLAQLQGTEMLSKRQARQKHPYVDDPDAVDDEIVAEGLQKALLAGLEQQAAQPGANVADIARIAQLVRTNAKTLAEAIIDVQKEAQERQASIDENGNPTGVEPGSPEAQPGLAAPGQGAEAGLASIPAPMPSAQHLDQLLSQLHTVQQAGPSREAA